MARPIPSILSLLVCSTFLSACDDTLAVTPASGTQDSSSENMAQPAHGQAAVSEASAPQAAAKEPATTPVAQTPVEDKAEPKQDASDAAEPVKEEPAKEEDKGEGAGDTPAAGDKDEASKPKKEDKVPDGAEPIPAPKKPADPLVVVKSEPLAPALDIEAMLAADPAKMSTVSYSKSGTKSAGPNVGDFVPNAKAMWLTWIPGSDEAILEIGVKAADVKYLPDGKDGKMLMVDADGKGDFRPMKLEAVNAPEAPERCVQDNHQGLSFFRTKIRIDIKRMYVMMTEFNNRRDREVVEFHPGTPEVARRHHVHRIDTDGLVKGEKVDLSLIAPMSPLGTLGARPIRVDRDRSLMIRDLKVIEDPRRTVNPCERASDDNMNKIWGFGFLMKEMAKHSGVSTQEFVESWLDTWSKNQKIFSKDGVLLDEISDHTGRALEHGVIADWRRRSGGGELDLRIAPFRLLSIIYRPDLGTRSPLLKPEQNNPGELRFVFGMMRTRDLNHDGDTNDFFETCRSIDSAVILEYKIPTAGCERTKAWANEMIELSNMSLGSAKYNMHLERLSRFVVRAGAAPGRANKSALGQLRTNEISLSTAWQMREFHLDAKSGLLKQTTVAETFRHHGRLFSRTRETPQPASLRGSDIMFNEIEENMSSILEGRYTMPEVTAHGEPLLSGGVTLLGPFGRFDSHKYRSEEQRRARFSIGVNTCDGCHTAETGTLFYHIFPNRPGRQTRFSAYLQNSPHKTTHLNANLKLEHHEFDETKTRVQALHGMANQVCSAGTGLFPLQMTEAPLKRMH